MAVSLFLFIPSQKNFFKEKRLIFKIDGVASTGDRGKCVSFAWCPVVAGLSTSTRYFLLTCCMFIKMLKFLLVNFFLFCFVSTCDLVARIQLVKIRRMYLTLNHKV
jgi:hypothetical protein